jgi:hypothetical protein
MMKVLSLIFALTVSPLFGASAENVSRPYFPICGATVGALYVHEVKTEGRPDKYMHCSISCVMSIYCGPIDSIEIGILKEVYDSMGFGDPDIQDLKADQKGIKIALDLQRTSSASRPACYQACSKAFP